MMFDMLYEYVYDAKLENKPLHDKGFIITREWEPSLTLCTGIGSKGELLDAVPFLCEGAGPGQMLRWNTIGAFKKRAILRA